jgi:hypothetical protein
MFPLLIHHRHGQQNTGRGATMLSDDQLSDFGAAGILRLSGAVPPKDAAALVGWEHLTEDLNIIRSRPETWTVDQPAGLRAITGEPQLQALGSATIRAALDDLLGAGCWQPPRRWGRPLITFPTPDKPWTIPTGGAWHNDFVPLRPGRRAVQLFTILQDLPARGGGTLVLTGSHQLINRYIGDTGEAPHPSRIRRALGHHPWLRDLWEPPETATADERIQRYLTGTRIGDAYLRIVELTGQAGTPSSCTATPCTPPPPPTVTTSPG